MTELAAFRDELKEIKQDQKDSQVHLNKSLNVLTTSINEMAQGLVRMEERDIRATERFNRIENDLQSVKDEQKLQASDINKNTQVRAVAYLIATVATTTAIALFVTGYLSATPTP